LNAIPINLDGGSIDVNGVLNAISIKFIWRFQKAGGRGDARTVSISLDGVLKTNLVVV